MTQIKKTTQNFLNDNSGASNLEIIVWFSVILVIATALFLFRDAVTDFISDTIDRIDDFARE